MIKAIKSDDITVDCDVNGGMVDILMELSAVANAVIDCIVEGSDGTVTRDAAMSAVMEVLQRSTNGEMVKTTNKCAGGKSHVQ